MRKTLIEILSLAYEIGNDGIASLAVKELAREYSVPVFEQKIFSIQDIQLFTPLSANNKIPAIKELRQRAVEAGMATPGLRESKEEIERRIAEAERSAATHRENYFQSEREWEDEQDNYPSRW